MSYDWIREQLEGSGRYFEHHVIGSGVETQVKYTSNLLHRGIEKLQRKNNKQQLQKKNQEQEKITS